jgi:hypothetical protein
MHMQITSHTTLLTEFSLQFDYMLKTFLKRIVLNKNKLWPGVGDGTFEEIALSAGVAYGQNGENTSAMGPATTPS